MGGWVEVKWKDKQYQRPKAALSEQPTLPTSPLGATLRNCRLLRKNPLVSLAGQSRHPLPSLDVSGGSRALRLHWDWCCLSLIVRLYTGNITEANGKHYLPDRAGHRSVGCLCYFTSVRTQFFRFLHCHLLALQGPVTSLTELPWSESQYNRKTSPRPMSSSPPYINCICAR